MKEKCGLFGAYSYNHSDAVPLVVVGLRALQHRGQESWGVATPELKPFKQRGLVSDDPEKSLPALDMISNKIAIGHVRYSTVGGSSLRFAQPSLIGRRFCIAHNGTICEIDALTSRVKYDYHLPKKVNDTSVTGYRLLQILKENNWDWFKSIELLTKELVGAYCILIVTNDGRIFAFRDTRGFRPLCIGWHEKSKSHLISSESCAFTVMGAEHVRDVKPGEIIGLSKDGIMSHNFNTGERSAHCSFEYTYFAHPSSVIDGISIYESRKRLGMTLADLYSDVRGDIVIPVPDSARPAALGFSERTGIPLEEGLMKDRYGKRGGLRSFIQPKIKDRVEINRWVIPVKRAVEGKDVIVIDDSIVRGISSKTIVKALRSAGAKSVKLLVTFPPITSPCRAGIDFPTHEELIAFNTSGKKDNIETINRNVAKSINADFVGYNTVENLSQGIGKRSSELCMSCHDGKYGVLNRNFTDAK